MSAELYQKYILYYEKANEIYKLKYDCFGFVAGHLLAAPLFVISAQKQLSITPNKDLYFDYLNLKTKEPEKLTLRKKIFQIMKSPIEMLSFTKKKSGNVDKHEINNKNPELIKFSNESLNSKEETVNKEKVAKSEQTIKENKAFKLSSTLTSLSNNKSELDKIRTDKVKKPVSASLEMSTIKDKYDLLLRKEEERNLKNLDRGELTQREKINQELIRKSGVPKGQQPYQAMIFDNYRDMFKSFKIQGILSYYKGTIYRILYFLNSKFLKINLNFYLISQMSKNNNSVFEDLFDSSIALISICLADVFFHPLFVVESRYILQNRLPHFRTYQSLFQYFIVNKFEIIKGFYGQIFKNIAFYTSAAAYSRIFSLYENDTSEKMNNFKIYSTLCIGTFFSYPILTAMRRYCCQSTIRPGMLPLRYINILHAVSLIKKEEGVYKGWYKGFLPFLCAQLILYYTANLLNKSNIIQRVEYLGQQLDHDEDFLNLVKRRNANII